MSTLGERITQARVTKGLLQKELADAIGVKSSAVISNWETDKNKPDAEYIVAIAYTCGVSVTWLLGLKQPGKVDVSPEENVLLEKFRALSPHAQETIRILIDRELEKHGEKSET